MVNKEIKDKAIEVTLWDAANKLRGSEEPAEYKHVVLGLIFLKFASDKFEGRRAKLITEGKEKYIEMADFYNLIEYKQQENQKLTEPKELLLSKLATIEN